MVPQFRVIASARQREVKGVIFASQFAGSFLVLDWQFCTNICLQLVCRTQSQFDDQPCPRCNGSGYEECMCTRWSDGDSGCSSCSQTGYMKCRSCRGGGKAIPLLQAVRKYAFSRIVLHAAVFIVDGYKQ